MIAPVRSNWNRDLPYNAGDQIADDGPNKCSYLCSANGFKYIGLQARTHGGGSALLPHNFHHGG